MPWEPGNNNGNKDPWGNRNKNDGPPDLEDVFKPEEVLDMQVCIFTTFVL